MMLLFGSGLAALGLWRFARAGKPKRPRAICPRRSRLRSTPRRADRDRGGPTENEKLARPAAARRATSRVSPSIANRPRLSASSVSSSTVPSRTELLRLSRLLTTGPCFDEPRLPVAQEALGCIRGRSPSLRRWPCWRWPSSPASASLAAASYTDYSEPGRPFHAGHIRRPGLRGGDVCVLSQGGDPMLSTFLHPNKNHRRTATRAAVIVLIFFCHHAVSRPSQPCRQLCDEPQPRGDCRIHC